MAYVPVPKDLNAVKTKVMFNLTKRQILCFGGQKFMPSALDKLRWLKAEREKRGLHYLLEVDGGVDDTTAPLCVEAGADVLVAGSAVFGKDDRTAAVRRLAAL